MSICLLIFGVIALLCAPQLQAASTFTAIRGGNLLNSDGSPPLDDAVILVQDGKIVKIGPKAAVTIPPNAEIIEAGGKWIIPGLIDAHIHFFQSGGLYTRPDIIDLRKYVPYKEKELADIDRNLPDTLARYLRCGITGVMDMGGPFWNFSVRDRARAAPLAPDVAIAGPLISTYQPEALTTEDPPIIKVKSSEDALALVQRQAEKKVELIKIWYIVNPTETVEKNFQLVQKIVNESHRLGLRVAVHATELATAKAAIKAGSDILVHSVIDAEVDDEFLKLAGEHHIIYIPTMVVFERYRDVLFQDIKLTPAEFALANPFIVSSLFDLRKLPPEVLPQERMARLKSADRVAIAKKNLQKVRAAGIPIASGTDAGNIGTLHGPTLFREFALMAEAGLSPMEILVSSTLNGAKVMGREKDIGSLVSGKQADLVILNSDPRLDVQNFSDITGVMKQGRYLPAGEIIKKNPVDIVQQQVNAYNARDIKAFLATYSPSIKVFTQPNQQIMAGLPDMQQGYTALFEKAPTLHTAIQNRIIQGNFVIDKEFVTGMPARKEVFAVAIYEVKNGLIENVWFIK